MDIKFKIILDPQNGTVDEQIFLYGLYEPNILDLYKTELKAGDTYIDIGANIGQHAFFANKCVGTSGTVRAFEPIPRLFKQITAGVALNNMGNFQTVQKAIGLINEEKTIYKTNSNIGGSSLIRNNEAKESETIVVANGAEQLADLAKIDFIKIDTEGYELIVLESILSILEKHRPKIIFEYNPELYLPEQFSILNKLKELNYDFVDYCLYDKNIIPDITTWTLPPGRKQTDIFCTPKKN